MSSEITPPNEPPAEVNPNSGRKRERRREDRRDQLLDVALHLFSKYGLEGTTTKDIAKEANVSPGLLYHYYSSKEDLLVDVVKRFRENRDLDEIVTKNDYGTAREALLRIMEALRQFFAEHIDELWLVTRAAARFPAVAETLRDLRRAGRSSFVTFFKKRVEAGELIPLSAPERLAGVLCQILVSEEMMQVPDRQDIVSIVEVVLYGLLKK